jgi:hypothetical protein
MGSLDKAISEQPEVADKIGRLFAKIRVISIVSREPGAAPGALTTGCEKHFPLQLDLSPCRAFLKQSST